ncbi:hypothetical protein [Pseudoalteromonas luteoviolacea]|uniref:hypothetical protein n=1 Tax=Pseudoalteromonas luteoviolacea TaxID=43657 RepID=UPI003AF93DF9
MSEGGAFTLDGTESHAPDGEIVSYLWQQVENGAPAIAIETPDLVKVAVFGNQRITNFNVFSIL